jgi:SPP1 gp7 family putative phage head morphogenesis protein
MPLTLTRDAKTQRADFQRAKGLELRYARELRRVAHEIGRIVKGFPVGTAESSEKISQVLERYSEVLKPWAESVAGRLVAELDHQDRRSWKAQTKGLSNALRAELDKEVSGQNLRALLEQHVDLITSLPIEAAQRVHKLTIEGLTNSTRAAEVAKEILETGHVTASRATLIARTETGRTQTSLMQARAQGIGSPGYIWRTSSDNDVRPSHKKMAGQFVRWDSPPTLDKLTGHAGCIPNCRCYPEPVIPEEL